MSLFKGKIYRLLASIDGSRKTYTAQVFDGWIQTLPKEGSLSLSRMNTISVYAAVGLNRRNGDSHISIDSCCVGCRVECKTIFFISPFGLKLLTSEGGGTNDSAVYNRFPFSFWKGGIPRESNRDSAIFYWNPSNNKRARVSSYFGFLFFFFFFLKFLLRHRQDRSLCRSARGTRAA
jgi:hypothetical protein